ncbi:FAD-dependent oxidoreductase [Cupriavidus sp.]|uniref:NAD(P)/FAD-dependent oxidoreductase n=1 Tax=Cupriavidus sp. TaxID=1873897 RepID=UPI0025BB54E5|nr:FAD-dependent oxidoreductase [Cupriavidus sp.]MCA3184988.1 FAD-dependent oxidoreductase [Cupriavidus sp.]MCA3193745.1 FAD-dependent oxidoreductase [Cupriavidus sp.]MCA3196282.1 FAD-dependent oxidoreductase [Cupriavidus sp.]MCA3203803.1 FAD-dependent oxidoreductase [Cupriavidus sp.]MCA3207847.1 FAD-dependent oxidoreductase [Cupriavidus sp.]
MHAGGVLVVGDGPAGCAAAISAAKAGCRVTMVGIGRSRAVPEFASSAALRLLDSIAPEVAARADVWLAEGGPGDTGRALDRARFDTGLREATVRAGVDYRRMPAAMLRPRVDGHRMVGVEGLSDSGMDADALAVIDATGVNGWLRRSVGLAEVVDSRPWWLQRGAGVLDGGRARHPATHFAIGPDGWLWRHAIPHGCIWTALRSSRDTTLAWPDDMQPVGRIWRECRRWRHLRQPAGAGFFVCGDAAGYLDPASGDGLRFALESGARAGTLAAGVVRWPQRGSLAAALYADWVLQTYQAGRTALAGVYAAANLSVR